MQKPPDTSAILKSGIFVGDWVQSVGLQLVDYIIDIYKFRFSLRVREVPGSTPGQAPFSFGHIFFLYLDFLFSDRS